MPSCTADVSPEKANLERLGRIARWGFPVVSLAVGIAVQILLPRILQMRLSDGAYVAYVGITALAGYMQLAEGGLQLSVMRELSALHGAGDLARYLGEARRAARLFGLVGIVGLAIAAVGLQSVLTAAVGCWPGAQHLAFMLSVLAVLVATAISLVFGALHTSLLYSTGRLLTGQLVVTAAQLLPVAALITALLLTRNLPLGLVAYAATLAAIGLGRGVHAWTLRRSLAREVSPRRPPASLGKLIGAGLALKVANVLPNAAFPHLLTVMAAPFVPTAIPARTLANASRSVSQAFMQLLQVHVTRRWAGGSESRAQGTEEYRLSALFMTSVHLVQLGAIALLVEPIFRWWLPHHADEVTVFLPGIFAEQALLSITLPCTIVFAATGRLRTLGLVQCAGVLLGLATLVATLATVGEAAYGLSLAVSALPLFWVAAWCELRSVWGFPPCSRATVARYVAAVAAAVGCVFYATMPRLVVGVIAIGSVPLLATALARIWRRLRMTQ